MSGYRPVSRRVIHLSPGDLRQIVGAAARGAALEGPAVAEFERAFAAYVGVKHAVATGSGRLGMRLCLEAWELPAGGEVLLPAYEDLSVPRAAAKVGLTPVCVDVDPATGNLDPAALAARIGPETVAVVAAHLFGNPADITAIREVIGEAEAASGRRIRLLEDCCHAVGTTAAGQHVGGLGDAGFFSFHATKPMMTFGGCVVTTNDDALAAAVRAGASALPFPPPAQLARSVRSAYTMHILTHRRVFPRALYPWLRLTDALGGDPVKLYSGTLRKGVRLRATEVRYTNLQAAVGLNHLERFDAALARRRENAAILEAALPTGVERPRRVPGTSDYFFVLYSDDPEALRARLLRRGVDAGRDLMRDCSGETGDDCPSVKRVRARSVQIPIYEAIPAEEMRRIAVVVAEALRGELRG